MSTKPILAFDTTTTGASIALMVNGAITTRSLEQTRQAAELVPAIDELLREAGVHYRDLATIVSTIGPGSFTGVRIGLATLHGLVLVHHTPIKTLTTLAAMVWQVNGNNDDVMIAMRAGKGELYTQRFRHTEPVDEIALYSESKTDWAVPCYGNHLAADDTHFIAGPDASILCAIAHHITTTSLTDALPLYIRPPDAVIGAPAAWLTAH